MNIKKILKNSSIKNPTLRQRNDYTPLEKTAIHRYNYDSVDNFIKWVDMLSNKERASLVAKNIINQ